MSGPGEAGIDPVPNARSRERLRRVLRPVWTVAAFSFLAWLLATSPEIRAALTELAVEPTTLSALGLLLFAKLLYAWGVAASLAAGGAPLGFRVAFHAYSLSQIGKYIPGGIWHFFGRHQIYRDRGITPGRSLRLIGMETALLLSSASLVGALVALLPAIEQEVGTAQAFRLQVAGLVGLISAIGAAVLAWFIARPWLRSLPAPLGIFSMAWVAAGLSVAVLLPETPIALSAPSYALSFAVGMAAVFAPAGIGVREAAFVLLAAPLAPTEVAAAAIILHRALYVLGDFAMALAALTAAPGPPRQEN